MSMLTHIDKHTPCTVEIENLEAGGVDVAVRVPTYSGGSVFKVRVERDVDGDWRVFLPHDSELEDFPAVLTGGHEMVNGICYLGAPDVLTVGNYAEQS